MAQNSPIAFHVILSTYGFWLPNDPRGSWSTFVRSPEIRAFGPATKVTTHRSVAHVPHDRSRRTAAKSALRRTPVRFTGQQALAVANGFAFRVRESGYVLHACSIMPDHVHAVVMRHTYSIEQVVRSLRQAATQLLLTAGLHPFADGRLASGRLPSIWSQGFWKIFLFTPADIERSIQYVEQNPVKHGLRAQRWPFVLPYRCD